MTLRSLVIVGERDDLNGTAGIRGLHLGGESFGGLFVFRFISFGRVAIECLLECLFDELATVNLHRRKRSKIAGKIIGF